jgi:Pentapeptide repeats (8 copies)
MVDVRFFDCDLSDADFSRAELSNGQFHGSSLVDIEGGDSLRDIVIDTAQVIPLSLRVFGAMGIRVDDERDKPVEESPRLRR